MRNKSKILYVMVSLAIALFVHAGCKNNAGSDGGGGANNHATFSLGWYFAEDNSGNRWAFFYSTNKNCTDVQCSDYNLISKNLNAYFFSDTMKSKYIKFYKAPTSKISFSNQSLYRFF
ncbi:MAG: hypothetical protein IJR49_05320, partial [Treponema sp.]|nr:hypothetical protein [Treponema sp.]